jgi:hypothetical protein
MALMDDHQRLRMMGENARSMARRDAAKAIVDELLRMIKKDDCLSQATILKQNFGS